MPAKALLAAARLSILPLLLLLSAQPKPAASFPSYRYKIPNGNRVPCPPPAGGSAAGARLRRAAGHHGGWHSAARDVLAAGCAAAAAAPDDAAGGADDVSTARTSRPRP